MRNKLGLMTQEGSDNAILNGLFALMAREAATMPYLPYARPDRAGISAASPLRDGLSTDGRLTTGFALTARACSRAGG